ncbi:MAG: hypothetical protein U9O78_02130 [Patescibacteria group bacterium]|nr:hypothetical protein [Patescibacteria group bacterium]
MQKVKPIYFRLLAFSILILSLVFVGKIKKAQAGNLLDVSVTLTNSRVSYNGSVSGSGAETRVDLSNPAWVDGDDEATDPLKVGDTLTFATTGDVTLNEIIDADTIRLSATVTTDEAFYVDEKTEMSVVFTTVSDVTGSTANFTAGYFRVLVPAITSDTDDGDGEPDAGYFDYDTDTPTVNCVDGSSHTFGAATEEGVEGGATVDGADYHVYRCNYSGGGTGDTITMTINDIINPAPKAAHDSGTADVYSIIVQHMDGATTIDSTTVKVGTIEAVKVSAEVVPSLSFSIAGDTAAQTRCGETTDVTTTSDTVPFGELSTGAFSHAAQLLSVTTNAVDGVTVQAEANDQLGLESAACAGDTYNSGANAYTCIWDSQVASMTHETEQDWGEPTPGSDNRGFGYSLDDDDSSANEAFNYDDAAGTFMAKHFADAAESQDPQTLFDSDSNPTNDADIYICYRIVPDALTSAGDYYNYITFIATPQF